MHKRIVKHLIIVALVAILLIVSVFYTDILMVQHMARELFSSPQWAAKTRKIILSAYMENEDYAGFGSYVNNEEINKPDLGTTFFFVRILRCLGIRENKADQNEISGLCLYNIEFLMNNPSYKIKEIDKTVCCKEKYIYQNLYMLNIKDLDKIREKLYEFSARLYENDRRNTFECTEKSSLQSNLIRMIYLYKSFKILGKFPDNIKKDRDNFIKLFNNDALFCNIEKETSCSVGLALIQTLEELGISKKDISSNVFDKRKKWFQQQVIYVENTKNNYVSSAIEMWEIMKTAKFFGIKITISNEFLQKIVKNMSYNGGWAVFGNSEIISPYLTFATVCILKNTDNLGEISKEKVKILLQYMKKFEVSGGFAAPYISVVDIVGTYYGLEACKIVNININKEKIANYLITQTKMYLKIMLHSAQQKIDNNTDVNNEYLKHSAHTVLLSAYYLSFLKKSLNILGYHNFDSKICDAVEQVIHSENFSKGVSLLPANEETLRGFYCLTLLSGNNCFTVLSRFNSLGSESGRYLDRDFYLKYWGKDVDRYIALDSFPPDLVNISEIFYIIGMYEQCKNKPFDNSHDFYSGYMTFEERLKYFGGESIYRKRLLSFENKFYGGFMKSEFMKTSDMDDTYITTYLIKELNIPINDQNIKKFLGFTVTKYGGFSLLPSVFIYKNKPDFISTVEGLLLLKHYYNLLLSESPTIP